MRKRLNAAILMLFGCTCDHATIPAIYQYSWSWSVHTYACAEGIAEPNSVNAGTIANTSDDIE